MAAFELPLTHLRQAIVVKCQCPRHNLRPCHKALGNVSRWPPHPPNKDLPQGVSAKDLSSEGLKGQEKGFSEASVP